MPLDRGEFLRIGKGPNRSPGTWSPSSLEVPIAQEVKGHFDQENPKKALENEFFWSQLYFSQVEKWHESDKDATIGGGP